MGWYIHATITPRHSGNHFLSEKIKSIDNPLTRRPSTKTLKRIRDGDMAILISRLFVKSNKYRNDVFGLTQPMFSNPLEMIVERGFPLLRRTNEILSTLRDAGLMNKLFIDFNYNMTILTSIRERKAHENTHDGGDTERVVMDADDEDHEIQGENPEIVLTVAHLEGAFTILLMGLFVSSIIFATEIIFHSKFLRRMIRLCWVKVTHKKDKKVVIKRKKIRKVANLNT